MSSPCCGVSQIRTLHCVRQESNERYGEQEHPDFEITCANQLFPKSYVAPDGAVVFWAYKAKYEPLLPF